MSLKCKKCDSEEFVSRGNRWQCTECGATQMKNLKNPNKVSNTKTNKKTMTDKSNNKKDLIFESNVPLTLDEMVAKFDVDLSVWKPINFTINSWDVTNSKGITYTNYQSKANLKRDDVRFKEEISVEYLLDKIEKKLPKFKPAKKYNTSNKDNMLEINLFDVHIDKLTSFNNSGEDYNLEIAKERLINTVIDIVSKANLIGYDTIYFPIGNDFFNADTLANTTTKGTQQDVDGLWTNVFEISVELISHVIEYLRDYASKVIIPVIRGNHDSQRSFFLGQTIKALYNKYEDVEVDARAIPTKYYKFGKCLLGYAHGDACKIDNLPLLMAQENPSDWADTKYREFHLGHLHHKRNYKFTTVLDEPGVTIRYMRSISGTDEWHYKSGYVGSVKGADGFIWNKDKGVEFAIESKIEFN